MNSNCIRLQRELPSLQSWIKTLTLLITENSSVRHRIEEGGSGVPDSLISSNKEERSLILLIMDETFLMCTKGNFSIESTSLDIWIKESSRDPDGNKPWETIIADRTSFIVTRMFSSFSCFTQNWIILSLRPSLRHFFYIKIIVKEVSCLIIKCIEFLALSICVVCAKDKNKSTKESWALLLGVLPFGGFSMRARLVAFFRQFFIQRWILWAFFLFKRE